MSSRGKQRFLASMLLALALWPGLHHILARRVGFDPWELFGWAMYSVPQARTQVRVEGLVDGEPQRLRISADEQEKIGAHARSRTTLGAWASGDALASELLTAHPEVEGVRVTYRRWSLDLETATLVHVDASSDYAQKARGTNAQNSSSR